MKDLMNIFKWNYKRFFCPGKSPWTETHCANQSYCANAISSMLQKHGKGWLLPVNIVLFLLGLIFLIADDALLANSQSAVLSITGIALACVFMVLKFDAWKLKNEKNILKLMYIVSMAFCGGYAALTYIFLILYENIVACTAAGGD